MTTLQKYLARDMAKSALLATVGLTLIMTTFAIIEPLRKEGLAPAQVLELFWYLVPVMLSLTLPVAALFAATITYGRFSMDQELTACRASGISTIWLLRPALVMAVTVSLLSLALSNFVAPTLARRGAQVAKANLRGLLYQQFRTRTYWRVFNEPYFIHADSADAEEDRLNGFVGLDFADVNDPKFVVASSAQLEFSYSDQGGAVQVTPVNLARGSFRDFGMVEVGQQTIGHPLPSIMKEDPAFYSWSQLVEILRSPQRSRDVQAQLARMHRDQMTSRLYDDMALALGSGPYELRDEEGTRYVFRSEQAYNEEGKRLVMTGPPPGSAGPSSPDNPPAGRQPVRVSIFSANDRLERTFTCQRAELAVEYGPDNQASVGVRCLQTQFEESQGPRHDEYPLGPMLMPEKVTTAVSGDLAALYDDEPEDPRMKRRLALIKNNVTTLQRKVQAEMHGRVAYGLGCFLLIVAGSALGLIFRGGQALSAFALSCIPGLVLIVLVIMGKQMVGNKDVPLVSGLVAIWSGVLILAGMAALLYARLARR